MATYAVATSENGAYEKTLVASTVDTVTFAYFPDEIAIYSDGAAAISFTVDGSTPTALGAGTFYIPAVGGSTYTIRPERQPVTATPCIVKLISAGTPKYGVWRNY